MDVEELVKNPPFSLTQVDVKTLRQTDEEYEPHTWTDLKEKVSKYILTACVDMLGHLTF